MRIAALIFTTALGFGTAAIQPSSYGPAPGSPVTVGRGSGTALIVDVNNDGAPDLVTRHLMTQRIGVLLGDRQGQFEPARDITLDYPPADIKLGDVNGDGVLDLAIAHNTIERIDVRLGDGRGAFTLAPGSPYTIDGTRQELNKRTLHLLDLDEDGHLDLATANGRRRNTLGVLFGDGRGGFRVGPGVTLESGRERYWYAFGDVNGDRHVDVVTASSGPDASTVPSRLLVQIGDGRGLFTPASAPVRLDRGAGPVAVRDVNGDGLAEVAVAHANGGVSILMNAGGRFGRARSIVAGGTRVSALALEDMNRDGRPDLVVATGESVAVYLAQGSSYAPAPGSPFRAGPGVYNFSLADVNADGRPDIAATSFEGDAVTVLVAR